MYFDIFHSGTIYSTQCRMTEVSICHTGVEYWDWIRVFILCLDSGEM